jgi:serine/threonine-protein kinase
VYEVDDHYGSVFIVMERLDGSNLKQHMGRQILTTCDVVDIAVQISKALGAAYAAGIVHRDIKPGNIVSSTGQVKVLDFGAPLPKAR